MNSGNDELLKYIWGVLKNNNCKLFRMNAIEEHIHILCELHPSVSLSYLIKDIKVSSSVWIKENHIYPKFTGWAEGYGAFTLSIKEKDRVVKYIINQQEHHKTETFREEIIRIFKENGIEFNEKYLL